MKHYIIHIKHFSIMLLAFLVASCAKDENIPEHGKGTLLDLSVNFGAKTRLAELPNPNEMGVDNKGLKNVGVYIYYTEDYAVGDLSKPYVRNMEFTVSDGKLLAANATGDDQYIYIYDKMTIVAFYPYNAEMSNAENHFTVLADEAKYPVTRNEYADQVYIPYRAQTTTDPTTAYYTILTFYPKYAYKLEVVVAADDDTTFPTEADVQLLPDIDPTDTADTSVDGKREKWYDNSSEKDGDIAGSNIQVYNAYIWTRDGNLNDIEQGDVLLKSDQLMLIASQKLFPAEGRIYRYGYNMSTGEIFIPTSSNFVYDRASLTAVNGGGGSYYQVCDIDLSKTGGDWTPISLVGGKYDGGGHKISNMVVNVSGDGAEAGLFSEIKGNTTIANIDLDNPKINATGDNSYAGGLVGRLNIPMTPAEKQQLIGNLPEGLSEVVKQALIQEILANAGNTQANIVASKVTNPEIIVKGKDPIVGGLVGQAGEKNEDGDSKSRIWDSAVVGGSIQVNVGAEANNENAYVGGFIGLNESYIGRTFTTMENITANYPTTDEEGAPVTIDKATGFGTMGDNFTASEGGVIEDSYAKKPDSNSGVKQLDTTWPSWGNYTGIWPIDTSGWLSAPSNSFWYSNGTMPDVYPTLQWERK